MASVKSLLKLLPLAVLLGLAACTTLNPATGERQFTSFMSPADEARVGAEQHPEIVAQMGGAYDDPEIGAYVASIGGRLAANTEVTNARYRFTVLDTPMVNAFALPGGYVYVTRGLVALANSEAELAGVIGHEIGHVTGRHAAERYSRGVTAGLFGAILGVAVGQSWAGDIFTVGAAGYLAGFSRDQEYEADMLGVRYMGLTGYDPWAHGDFLANLNAESEFQARLSFEDARDASTDFFSTHPNTEDRVRRAWGYASEQTSSQYALFRNPGPYLAAIDGMIWGDSPEQGYARGRVFSHPAMRFTFTAPPGFRFFNSTDSVIARSNRDALIIFTADQQNTGRDVVDYMVRDWLPRADLRGLERIRIGGLEAATATLSTIVQGNSIEGRVVAIRLDESRIAKLEFIATPAEMRAHEEVFRRTTYSFRRLTESEVRELRPLRIRVRTVGPGDTVAGFARQMAFDDFREERFRVLNGLGPADGLVQGQAVKIIAY